MSPIFIVGVPRSGTTLLAAILGAHPRIVCGQETHFFTESFSEGVASEICRDPHWPDRAINYLESIRLDDTWFRLNHGVTLEVLKEALAARQPSVRSVLSGFMELFMQRHGGQRWCEKTPDHLPYVARIRQHYPESPIIRIVRDPRSVLASMLNVRWGPPSLLSAIRLYRDYEDRSARFFQTDSQAHTVKYEELLRDPESVVKTICRLLGESYDPEMLDTSESAKLVNPLNRPWKSKVAERIDPSRAGSWKESLTDDQLRLIDAILGDVIRAHGYPGPMFNSVNPITVHPVRVLDQYPDVISELVSRGGRFWRTPDENPQLQLLLGSPDGWGAAGTAGATARAFARLATDLVRYRLSGAPISWFRLEGQGEFTLPGRMLARLIPRSQKPEEIPRFPNGRERA